MNTPTALPDARRTAFSRLLRDRRLSLGLKQGEAAQAVYDRLDGDGDPVPREWIRDIESAPAAPLASFVRLDAYLDVLDLGWPRVLDVLGARCAAPACRIESGR